MITTSKTTYYGSRISDNMTLMPEGYLVCHNVPICRTGSQKYLAQEIGLNDRYGELIEMYRPEEEVFAPEAMASFEGKPVTDNHPSDDVRPDNWSAYAKGTCTKVRRGSGEDADKVIADLIINDAVLISEIQGGKREISCGYDYVRDTAEDGQLIQRQIRGNHVAVVQNGRAGKSVSIRDTDTTKEKGSRQMENKKPRILGRMLKAFAQDAEPDEVMDAMEIMAGAGTDPAPETPPANDEGEKSPLTQIMAKLETLEARLGALESKDAACDEEEDPLAGLERELSSGDAGEEEESVTLPAEEMTEEKTTPAVDSQTLLGVVRAIKPAIAELPPEQRKKAADSLNTAIRGAMGKPAKPEGDQYTDLLVQRKTDMAKDQAAEEDPAELGKRLAKKYNPHYAKEVK